MAETKVIDVGQSCVCRRCGRDCCGCKFCVAHKGGHRDLCNRCYEKVKLEASADAGGAT